MQQRRSSTGRPSGTDGSDFSYRMVVDSRYQRVAEGRSRLCGLAIIQITGAVYLGLSILKEDSPSSLAISSVVAGFLAIVVGELGRRRSRAILLRLYSFLTIAAATLSVIVLAGGDLTLEDVKNIDISGKKKLEFLEAARVLLGLLVQILAIKTTFSLIHNMSPPKRAS
ncbi:hypothetical protein MLD38_024472 [Melastoma candidum]|uniref:Uncharacterized protein n=1 Tax=Melastoma candidum TaxID=119954 RepID=A0ACB9NTD8_9MYRT|nr:hypothetical protein MLD38_024472 [Melastoma candidum]